jgi:hypothetical protein
MSDLNHQINLALRTAAGHDRAARDTEAQASKAFEMKKKSAGASLYEAWGLAVRAQPEYKNYKIDDKALARIYESNKPRPWWDKHLAAVRVDGKPADREWAKRLLQWHLDPNAARARHAMFALKAAAQYKRLKEQGNKPSQGGYSPRPASSATDAKHSDRVTEANTTAAAAGRELPAGYGGAGAAQKQGATEARTAVLGLLARAERAVRGMTGAEQLAEAESLVRGLVDELEAL